VLPTDSHMGPSSYAFRGRSGLLMSIDLYEVRPSKDHRGVDLISEALPFDRLWYGEPFGLSKEWIQEELGPLLDHYSLGR
jgi:hypothetical protein